MATTPFPAMFTYSGIPTCNLYIGNALPEKTKEPEDSPVESQRPKFSLLLPVINSKTPTLAAIYA